MPALIVALGILLAAGDPYGWHVYQYFQARVELVPGPIMRGSTEYLCWTSWEPRQEPRIECAFERERAYWSSEEHWRIWAACTLVHEAWHARTRTSGEEVPILAQYVCLSRLGAPGWMLDRLYSRLVPGPDPDDD